MKTLGIAGYSGSGKTTLIEKVIPLLVAEGLRVSLIKHAHHEFDVDQPGKDSYRHRHAGCTEVLVSSSKRWALMHELRGAAEASLQEQVRLLSPCDLVIVEGYKSEAIPKIEVHRRPSRPTSRSRHPFHRSTSTMPAPSPGSSSSSSGSTARAWFADSSW